MLEIVLETVLEKIPAKTLLMIMKKIHQ